MKPESRRVRIDLAYDGTEFAGWQVQRGQRTVQGVVADALTRLQGGEPVSLRAAGRTDSGVHARGQVADARIRSPLGDRDLGYALRRILPGDVRPASLVTVPDDFHARISCTRRTYRYCLDRSLHGDPFLRRFAWHHPWPLDEDLLQAALAKLPGTRDWSGFTASKCTIEDRVRTLDEASLAGRASPETWLTFKGSGFLTYMVRNLVGTVLEIATGRMEPERIEAILESGDRNLAAATAPAHGLCLWHLEYPGFDGPSGRMD